MPSIIETIQKRVSVRSYSDQEVTEEVKAKFRIVLEEHCQGPFGNSVRFELVEAAENIKQELKELGTYGFIRGSRLFIGGAVKKGGHAMEDFGYCMEQNVLKATEWGLGTCWLGGALNRSTFAQRMNASPDEVIPAITPLGYPGDKPGFVDTMTRIVAGSRHRKEFGELFYSGDCHTPLEKISCGKYELALECVRVAPSASNKQPWRIIKEKERNCFHFYLKENSFYNHMLKDIQIQNLDLGIALCHFELAAKELGLKGEWIIQPPQLNAADWQYIASWEG
jgi:Nitroreductase